MKRRLSQVTIMALAGLVASLALIGSAQAATEKVIYNFSGADGSAPHAGLIFDAARNLYGTTTYGGSAGFGTVFKLSPDVDGTWSESVLYSFQGGTDGSLPFGTLIFDHAGNLYGTASNGGYAFGTVFELSPNTDGTWTENSIHIFTCCSDGSVPYANLIFDTAGNLYGITTNGGAFGSGTVFELTPEAGGSWSESLLYSFANSGSGGNIPMGGLVMDSVGNLYGTTSQGGSAGGGNVFELSPSPGTWNINVLHNFTGNGDGAVPNAGVIFDTAGNLYGTTGNGGAAKCACGTVFRLKPSSAGGWIERVMHSFNGTPGNGPGGALVLDTANNLYGTTYYSGKEVNGMVFKLDPSTGVYTVLHMFSGTDGSGPSGSVVLDSAGNLYSTTAAGGANGKGVVFEVIP
jgi:uncharacterized repeat protein (TIGR03803 family)